jgi:hypothetical protein
VEADQFNDKVDINSRDSPFIDDFFDFVLVIAQFDELVDELLFFMDKEVGDGDVFGDFELLIFEFAVLFDFLMDVLICSCSSFRVLLALDGFNMVRFHVVEKLFRQFSEDFFGELLFVMDVFV